MMTIITIFFIEIDAQICGTGRGMCPADDFPDENDDFEDANENAVIENGSGSNEVDNPAGDDIGISENDDDDTDTALDDSRIDPTLTTLNLINAGFVFLTSTPTTTKEALESDEHTFWVEAMILFIYHLSVRP